MSTARYDAAGFIPAATGSIPTATVRQYATATGRIPAAGNNTAKSIPATSYYRFHLFLIRRNTEKGAACQKAVP